MTDVPGESGFEVASAYVSVSPDAASFPEQLEEQIGDVNFVVQIPVVPDAADFAAQLESEVAGSGVAVQVPVVPDTEGFQLLIDSAVADAKATVTVPVVPDAAGFAETVDAAVADDDKSVTVPVVPDMAGFAETTEAEAGAAGEAAGTAFSEKLAAAAEASGLSAIWPEADAGAGPAGETAGATWGEQFAAAAEPRLSALLAGNAVTAEAETAGEEAGTGFLARFSAALGRLTAPLADLLPAAETEGAEAGEVAGVSFASRFSAAMAGLGATLDKTLAGTGAEASAAGAEAGEGFVGTMKTVLLGGMSPMEAALGAGFIAVTADMASKFQAAMEQIHTQAQVPQSAIAGLSSSVLALAGNVGSSPDSLAEALYHVESTFSGMGLSGQKAMQLLQTAAEGARVGGANLVDTTNALDATVVSGISGAQNYSQAMGALNGIVGAGDMTMQNLNETMTTGLMANAKLYGQSLPQVGAALDTLGDNLIRGAKAGTDLRMTWQAMLDPLSTAGPMLSSIGLKAGQLGTTLTHAGLSQAIDEFVQHLQASKVPIDDWGTYVTDIFGKKAGTGIGVLIENYARLNSKFADISKDSKTFAGDWAATEATTKQKLADLEASFESLLVKIGSALLPTVNKFMGDVNSALPGLEKFGAGLVKLVAPVVSVFFQGLGAIVKELVSFLSKNAGSLEKFGTELVKLALPVVHTFFSNLLSIIKEIVGDIEGWLPHFEKLGELIAKLAVPAVGLFFTGLGGILKLLFGPLKDVTLAVGLFALAWKGLSIVMDMNPFIAIGTALIILVGVIIKYHKQILDFIEKTWGDISKFVSKIWDDLVSFAKAHWLELLLGPVGLIIKYHEDIWKFIQRIWNDIYKFFSQVIGKVIDFFKSSWDTIWGDIKTVWNNIHNWLVTWWNDEIRGWQRIVTTVEGWLRDAWDTIKNDAVTGFDNVRHSIAHVWDMIVSDIEGFIKTIESKIAGIGKTVISLPGKLLGDIGLAGGGVLPGYAPGHDSVHAMLSPGEAVLVPEAVRAIGPGRINAINAAYRGGRGDGYALGGTVPSFAAGGIAGNGLSPYAAGAAAGQMYSAASTERAGESANGINVTFIYNGTMQPTPEQQQAMMMQLGAAVGVS